MDFSLTREQSELAASIDHWCRARLNDGVIEDDANSRFNHEKWKMCGEFGIMGMPISQDYGGLGHDMLTTAIGIESFARACQDEGLIFSVLAHLLSCMIAVEKFGTQEQKQHYLPRLCSGEWICGNGMTEAGSGSDITTLSTTVMQDADHYTVQGAKLFVTNGPIADLFLIYARHPQGMKMVDVSAFLIAKETPGLSIGQRFHKMGLRTSPLSEVILDSCRLCADAILGRQCWGMEVFNHSMIWERTIMAAYHVGAMQRQYELVQSYANTRKQFGTRLVTFQNIADLLVGMKMRIETSRLLLYKTCWLNDTGKGEAADASLVKLLSSESKVKNSLDAVQIFGGYGYLTETGVERQLRDSIAATLYSGTSQMQSKIIAEKYGVVP